MWEQYQRLDGAFLPAYLRVMFLERLQARVACRSTKRLRADVAREAAQALNIFNEPGTDKPIDLNPLHWSGVNGGKR